MSSAAHPIWLEVSMYLGPEFDPRWCNGADDKVTQEFKRYPDAETFYRETNIYCYQNVAYFLEGIKRPYYAKLFDLTPNRNVSLLDYGCGAGDDGLLFAQAGYSVTLADVPSRTLEFCKWRAAHRITAARVAEIGRDTLAQHDMAWCMDVLEHFPPDQHAMLLDTLGALGHVVIVNLVNDPLADHGVHYPVDQTALTDYVSRQWATWYQDYYDGKVRLLVYGDALRVTE